MANPQNLKPFKKGDPRCWRHGRPKSFETWRKLAVDILTEPAINKDTGKPLIINDHIVTNAEAILRSWLASGKNQINLVEAAVGKVPTQVDLNVTTPVTLRVVYDDEKTKH